MTRRENTQHRRRAFRSSRKEITPLFEGHPTILTCVNLIRSRFVNLLRLRRSRPLILVVCGAKCTEPQYFRGLRDSLRSRAVDIVITQQAKAPIQVVEYAVAYAERSAKDFDEVWCVVDVDEFDLGVTFQAARSSGVKLAVSNPCFELWLLLHLEDCRSRLEQCAAAERRRSRSESVDGCMAVGGEDDGITVTVPELVKRARRLERHTSIR